MNTIERQLQQNLNRIQSWADENGFKLLSAKTACVHFCQLRRVHLDPELYITRDKISLVAETKFMGLYFDRKLTLLLHIKYVNRKCLKALAIVCVVAH